MTNDSNAASRSQARAAASSASANASAGMASAISPQAGAVSQKPPLDVVTPHRIFARSLGLAEVHRYELGDDDGQHENEQKHTDSPAMDLRCRENTDEAFRVAFASEVEAS